MSHADERSPEELIRAALALLREAGVALPGPLLTVTEAAALACTSTETIRTWCRTGTLGFYDARLFQFLIPLDQLRRVALAKRGRLSRALEECEISQAQSILSSPACHWTKTPSSTSPASGKRTAAAAR
jgi:hypothetical protein